MALDVAADFAQYQKKVAEALVNLTRSANTVATSDLGFHRSSGSADVSNALKSCDAHLLQLTNKLLRAVTNDAPNARPPSLKKREDVDDKWRDIVDVVDDLLEKADASLDEFNGVIKRLSPSRPSTPENPTYRNANILRPQAAFDQKVDNFNTSPWKPLLKTKPHAQIALEEAIGPENDAYNHPYAFEIQHSVYPESTYRKRDPISFTWPAKSEAIWVDTEDGVQQMLAELKKADEIAVDLEHNDKNSYVGMVCLMQVSTRTQDWIVDTLKPWRQNLQVLNEVFADPKILKVFHGSNSDMVWLQRDLGIYVVGLFDTYWAACALNLPHKSLAFLLGKYVNYVAQKQYQMSDWRIRPLPKELIDYARDDTHYLLYIYDHMRNALIDHSTPDGNLVDYVLQNSKTEALQKYERVNYDEENGLGPGGWLKMLIGRTARVLEKEQFGVLRALHRWRDVEARKQDVGEHTIMSANFLWNCAQQMPLDLKKLFDVRAMGKIPPVLMSRGKELVEVIRQGKSIGRDGPSVQDVIQRNAHRLPRSFRHQHPPPSRAETSMAATVKQLISSGEMNGTQTQVPQQMSTEVIAPRTSASIFWGSTHPSTETVLSTPLAAQSAMNFVRPTYQLTPTEINLNDVTPPEQATVHTPTEAPIIRHDLSAPSGNEIFTISDRKKRKLDDLSDDGGVPVSPTVSTPDAISVSPANISKAARKAAKKAKKEADKAAKAAADADFQPFDYANAPSLLHSGPGSTNGTAAPSVKPMNPYAKALDTSTGARRNRMGKELAGRSQTFKS